MMEKVSLLFWPGRPQRRYQWVSRHDGKTVVLCDLSLCPLCNLSERENLRNAKGSLGLEVQLELRRSYGGIGIASRERYVGHLVSRSKAEVTEVIPRVIPEIIPEPEGAEIDIACNVILCQSQGLGQLIDPGAIGFNGKGKEIVQRLVQGRQIRGVWITHAHMDHYDGLSGLGRKNPPIFMTSHTQQVILSRREKTIPLHLIRRAELITPGQPPILEIGPFKVSTFPLSHSVPGTMGLFIRGSRRKMVYLGDFKLNGFDSLPMAQTVATLKEIAKEGVDILAFNIVNAHLEGFTPIEALAIETITNVLARAKGRVIVTCFSSNLERIRRIVEVAQLLKRPVAFYGAGMRHSQELLGIKTEGGAIGSEKEVIFVTGCQAEEDSVLWRIAERQNPPFELWLSDTLVLSSRGIPGRETELSPLTTNLRPRVDRLIVHRGEVEQLGLKDLGVEEMLTHTSGHEYGGGLRLVLEILQPKEGVFVWPQTEPQIGAFRKIAQEVGVKILPETERIIEI